MPDFTRPFAAERKLKHTGNTVQVFIDPGHGGDHTGAMGPGGLIEKEVNLKVGLRLKAMLQRQGIEVATSRQDDTTVELEERVQMAGNYPNALFLSIHHNANGQMDERVNRAEIYYYWWKDGISREFGRILRKSFITYLKIPCLYPRPALYRVMREIPEPCVLGEACYIIHPESEHNLRTEEGVQREAVAYYRATVKFLRIRHALEEQYERRKRSERFGRKPLGYIPFDRGTYPQRDDDLIVIDPGGREGYNPDFDQDFRENAKTSLRIAKLLVERFEKCGYRVALTRKTNRGTVSPVRRARFIFVKAPGWVIMVDHRYPLNDGRDAGVFYFPGDRTGETLAAHVHHQLKKLSGHDPPSKNPALSPFTSYLMIQCSAPRILVVPYTLDGPPSSRKNAHSIDTDAAAEAIFQGFISARR
jgi:N-acetylmuramoyl-L-alanine amidase